MIPCGSRARVRLSVTLPYLTFRFSGHHFDLSFAFDSAGGYTDFPVFLGHNPLIVPKRSPPHVGGHEDYIQWRNSAGVPQFPDAVSAMLR